MNIPRYREGLSDMGGLKTARSVTRLRAAIKAGRITTFQRALKQGERIDQIAAAQYGDARLWWVIAAASNIGWWMQAPPGTRIVIPTDIAEVEAEI